MVSSTSKKIFTSAFPERALIRLNGAGRSVDDRRVDRLTQLAADRVGARRTELGEEQHDQLFFGVDEEGGGGGAAPVVLPGSADDLRNGLIEQDRKTESE